MSSKKYIYIYIKGNELLYREEDDDDEIYACSHVVCTPSDKVSNSLSNLTICIVLKKKKEKAPLIIYISSFT